MNDLDDLLEGTGGPPACSEWGPTSDLRALLEEGQRHHAIMTLGPWRWWTSCSHRRLSSEATGKDGDVLHGEWQRHDGHPDVVAKQEDMDGIAWMRNHLPDLLQVLSASLEGSGSGFLRPGDRVRKITGDYSVTGVVAAVFQKRSGAVRLVIECDQPAGLLLILSPEQVQPEVTGD